MEISKHLIFEECTHSDTADKLGIRNNNPNLHHIDNMKLLAENVLLADAGVLPAKAVT